MRVIPVLDLKAGQAVHALAGDRVNYRPIRSVWHPSTDPILLAKGFRERYPASQHSPMDLYLADLDAIGGRSPNLSLYARLKEIGLNLWLDCGLRDAEDVAPLLDAGVPSLVAGLETLEGPAALKAVVDRAGRGRVVFSLDLREGRPLVETSGVWGTSDPFEIALEATRQGVQRLLLLDLARVGIGRGLGTLELLLRTKSVVGIDLEVIVGGGVSTLADLPPLAEAGASAVLVGSAIHDGRMEPGWFSEGSIKIKPRQARL